MMKAIAFCPAHITGFFKPEINHTKPELIGSTGAGFSIEHGITTSVVVKYSTKTIVRINNIGYKSDDNRVSEFIINEFLKLTKKCFFVDIKHNITIPIGYGLGCSGAVALSLSLALNKAFNYKISRIEASRIAHKAEIICKTGLGDVLATFYGGFEIRTKCGAPGIGLVKKIQTDNSAIVIIGCLSPINTKKLIKQSKKMSNLGTVMINRFKNTRSSDEFQDMSLKFAKCMNIITPRMELIIHELHKYNIKCGIALFGETIFSIIHQNMEKKVCEIMKKYQCTIIKSKINKTGARIK